MGKRRQSPPLQSKRSAINCDCRRFYWTFPQRYWWSNKRMLFLYRNPVQICQCVDCATAQGGSFWGSGEHQHWVYNLGQLPSPPLPPPPYTYSSICSTGLYSPGHQSIWCEWRNWQSDSCTLDCREFLKSPAVQQSKLHTDSQLSLHSQLGLRTVEGSPSLSHSLDSKLQRTESSVWWGCFCLCLKRPRVLLCLFYLGMIFIEFIEALKILINVLLFYKLYCSISILFVWSVRNGFLFRLRVRKKFWNYKP